MQKIIQIFRNSFIYIFLGGIFILTVYPLYWLFFSGTYSADILPRFIFKILPGTNIAQNYKLIYQSFNMVQVLFNTFFVAIIGTALSVFVNMMMGYALAKFDFRYKKIVFNSFVVTLFVAGATTLIPSYEIISKLRLYNTLWAIILPSIYSTYTAFLARQTLLDFPSEILDAGRIDGCGEFNMFWTIVVPNAKAIVATIALITFMNYWNSYLWNLIVTSSVNKFTLQVALASIYPKAGMWTYAHIKMLGASISIIPILILFVSMQKQFVNSLTGAVKG